MIAAAMLAALVAGCPDDDTDVGESTGGDGDGDGDGTGDGDGDGDEADAGGTGDDDGNSGGGGGGPGDPALEDLPRSPWTIGNGLAHDSRPLLGVEPVSSSFLATWPSSIGVDEDFFGAGAPYVELRLAGFRAAQPGIRGASVTENPFGHHRLSFEDDSLYVSDDDANLRTELSISLFENSWLERITAFTDFKAWHHLFADFGTVPTRPLSIELFAVAGDGYSVGHAVTWVRDRSPVSWSVVGLLYGEEMAEAIAQKAEEGMRPISVSSRRTPSSALELAAIFVHDNIAPEDTFAELSVAQPSVAPDDEEGLRPFYVSSVDADESSGDGPRFDVLYWRAPESVDTRFELGLTGSAFGVADWGMRTRGYHLVSSTSYRDGAGVRRWAAIWHRYGLVAREQEVEHFEVTPDTQTFWDENRALWEYLETKIEPLMQGASYIAPQCGFAALHQGEVVFEKAYTWAPEIYPEAKIGDVYPWQSASKSITAAAAFQALADDPTFDLDDPFVEVLGWDAESLDDTVAGVAQVTVRELLEHRAGWVDPGEYDDHALLRQELEDAGSPLAVLPISTEAVREWTLLALQGELVGADIQPEAVWKIGAYQNATWKYSNLPYTLAGEVVGEEASQEYEDYVQELLAPLGLTTMAPLWETRLPVDGRYQAIRSDMRHYLTLTQHPYRNGVLPRFDTSGLPEIEDELPVFRPTTTNFDIGIAPLAPPATTVGRYGGKLAVAAGPLPAGGWSGSVTELARVVRALMPDTAGGPVIDLDLAAEMVDPTDALQTPFDITFVGARYAHGWYLYRNWIMAQGGAGGGMALAIHNRAHDVTYALACNRVGTPILNVFASAPDLAKLEEWGYPCVDHPDTVKDECTFF